MAKKFDYYAHHQPWRMPKWLGATLGGIFSLMIVGAGGLIYHLTRPPAPRPVAILAAPKAAPTPPSVAAAAAAAPVAVAQAAPTPLAARPHRRHHARHHRRVTVAAATHHASQNHRDAAIVARHRTRSDRKAKDDLDRLLGL